MAVTRVSQSTVKQGLDKNKNFVAGIPPILGRYYLMGSVTVGSGGASSIEFTDIPPIYKHLKVRMLLRSDTAAVQSTSKIEINGDTGANYKGHELRGDGSTASATSTSGIRVHVTPAASAAANIFGACIIDIPDYANTSKNTTVRVLGSHDRNGAGQVNLYSGLWVNTSAVTSLKFTDEGAGNFVQYSTASIYGIGRVS